MCVLEVHPEKDTVHSLLTIKKGEVSKRNSGHCPATIDNSIEIDISNDSKSQCQEVVTGALKGGAGEKRMDHMEECSSIDTSDESRTRLHRAVLTIMQESTNQTINPRPGHDHRYFDNTNASKSREEMKRENCVNSKEFQDCKESRQSVRLQTPMEVMLVSDSSDESRC